MPFCISLCFSLPRLNSGPSRTGERLSGWHISISSVWCARTSLERYPTLVWLIHSSAMYIYFQCRECILFPLASFRAFFAFHFLLVIPLYVTHPTDIIFWNSPRPASKSTYAGAHECSGHFGRVGAPCCHLRHSGHFSLFPLPLSPPTATSGEPRRSTARLRCATTPHFCSYTASLRLSSWQKEFLSEHSTAASRRGRP